MASTPLEIPSPSGSSDVYMTQGGSPSENMYELIEMLGGIESLIDKDDIVILKPNSQWRLQGMTNTDSMLALMEMILKIPGYSGEVIIADNHQFKEDNSLGWTTDTPNGRFNLNEVVEYFQDKGYPNVTKYHWHDAGANPNPLQGDAHGNSVVEGSAQDDGYVWEEDNFYKAENGNICLMTYPIFTSKYSGITIDLKNGAFKNNEYTGQPVKFINISSLNHHSIYCGVTAAVKNLMGVVDMSCGTPAPEPADTYNTHHIGLISLFLERLRRKSYVHWRIRDFVTKYIVNEDDLIDFHYTGGVLGHWMKTVRLPDMNIITAEWIGYGSRIDTKLSARPKALIASKDAVAADYYASKHILLPETEKAAPSSNYLKLNDPDNDDGPFRKFLIYTARETGGAMRDSDINVITN
ncbi:MAG: DUF362 domain-containing protein [candidate division Zixibacteria bacterium]|nr:DUF362 domain-containing protein [candidate division Zixibacteria bacterium]